MMRNQKYFEYRIQGKCCFEENTILQRKSKIQQSDPHEKTKIRIVKIN